ncbi:MAG TPA: ABC transporter permease subunit [Candidatus Limnocylindria bacterium]|jgi:ABC-type transport system involved in multi-copper enzyme maturation permease subunit
MSLPLLRLTARLWRTPAIWWPLGWGIYVLAVGAVVVSISRTIDFEAYLRALPPALGSAFGLTGTGPGGERYGGAVYVLGAQLFGSALIVAGIFAMFVAPGLIARDAERGTLDTLLARPVPHRTYALTRLLFFALVATAFGAATLAGSALAFGPVGGYEIPWRGLLACTALLTLGALAFGALGLAAAAARLSSGAGAATIAIALGAMFVLNLAASSDDRLAPLARISFFHYWQPIGILFSGTLDGGAVALYGGVAALAGLLTVVIFTRRDIV